jgi:hypothetical protein
MAAEILQTPYGVFGGVTTTEFYPDGNIQGICLEEQNVIITHAGELIPYYGEETLRRKHKASVTFHPNGMIKAVALEEQQEVLTPIGELPAELITFYETGEVCRVFPLDGKISGFWSEEDERALGFPLSFDFGFTAFSALVSGICFYKSGCVRSVTLFPKETIKVLTARYGLIPVRQGFSLFDDGTLESLEPAAPVKIETPVGVLAAYNANAHGINADSNSLSFDREGQVSHLMTSSDKITIQIKGNRSHYAYTPRTVSLMENDGDIILPLGIYFDYTASAIHITDPCGDRRTFSYRESFVIIHDINDCNACTAGGCTSCRHCG